MSAFLKMLVVMLVFAFMFHLMGAPKWGAVGLAMIIYYLVQIKDLVRK